MPSRRASRWSIRLLTRCRRIPGSTFPGTPRSHSSRRSVRDGRGRGQDGIVAVSRQQACTWPIRFALVMAVTALFGQAVVHAQTSVNSVPGADAALIDDVVTGSRVLADFGVLDGFGHVSARHPANPNRFLMSRSLAPALVTADDIMEFDLDGNAVDARGRSLFLERFIHSEIYRARPDVMSVVHTHSPGVIPFTVSQVALRPVFHNAAFLAAGAPVWDIRKEFGETDMLVSNAAIGKALAQTLGDKPMVLMRVHTD